MCVCVLFHFAIRRVLQIFISIFWALFYSGGRTKVVIYIFSVVVSDLGSHIYICIIHECNLDFCNIFIGCVHESEAGSAGSHSWGNVQYHFFPLKCVHFFFFYIWLSLWMCWCFRFTFFFLSLSLVFFHFFLLFPLLFSSYFCSKNGVKIIYSIFYVRGDFYGCCGISCVGVFMYRCVYVHVRPCSQCFILTSGHSDG